MKPGERNWLTHLQRRGGAVELAEYAPPAHHLSKLVERGLVAVEGRLIRLTSAGAWVAERFAS